MGVYVIHRIFHSNTYYINKLVHIIPCDNSRYLFVYDVSWQVTREGCG